MSTPASAGREWERKVVAFLRESIGRAAYLPVQFGFVDVGDVHADPFTLQCRAQAKPTWSKNLDDAVKQAAAAGADYGAAVVPRRGRHVGEAYAVMTLADLRSLIARVRSAESRLAKVDLSEYESHKNESKNV